MPLYSDSSYYYSGGSSQLYSPYWPSSTPTSSSYSVPYSSTYNRMIGGSYSVPLSSLSRPTSSYATTHGLSSRYQPKLTTITESSPLISSSRHGVMPLTRTQSPKYSTYSTPSTSSTTLSSSRYIPARPISINTADIDVSASRYRKQKETEAQREAKKRESSKSNSQTPSPSGSTKRGSKEKPKKDTLTPPENNERRDARSTIRRNRPVVRLSMIRANSKDLNADINEPPDNKFHDLPRIPDFTQENVGWRQRLAEDLANIPVFPAKKSPGDLIRERYLLKEEKPAEAPKRDIINIAAGLPQTIEQVVVELDPLHHTIRRLSLPQCPTFHDICEDISSDKIDDDLNAGELRRRASLLQEQEQEILNQLQQSGSGTFQLIHLERRGSHESQPDETLVIGAKPKHKKSKKVRHKITAFVDVENPEQMPVLVERDEDVVTPALKTAKPKPKFTFNVDSVEEHDEINKVFKLPKKKGSKRASKTKGRNEEEQKAAQKYVSRAEIFTFSQKSIEANEAEMSTRTAKAELDKQNIENVEVTKSKAATPNDSPKPKSATLTSREKIESVEISKSTKSEETPIDSPKRKKATLATRQNLKNVKVLDSVKSEETPVNSPKPEKATLSTSESKTGDLDKQNIEEFDIPISKKSDITTTNPPKPQNASISNSEASENQLLEQTIQNVEISKPEKTTKTTVHSPKPVNATLADKEKLENVEIPSSTKTNSAPVDSPKPVNAILSTVQQQEKKLKTPSPTRDALTPPTLSTSASLELAKKKQSPTQSSTVAKSKSFQTVSDEKSKLTPTSKDQAASLEDTTSQAGVFQSTVSLDIGYNSTPKEVSKEPGVATPKPIRKGVQKSESGEDFWATIGSRETIYMEIRKKSLHEIQWEKEEAGDGSKPVTEKTSSAKEETPATPKDVKVVKKVTPKIKISPTLSKNTEALEKPLRNILTTGNEKEIPEEVKLIAPKTTEASTGIKTTIAATTAAATSPKINIGQEAKSPEQQTTSTTASTALFTSAETSDQTSINNASTSPGTTVAKAVDVSTPAPSEAIGIPTKTPSTSTVATKTTSDITPQTAPTNEKHLQPEANRLNKVTEGTKIEKKCTDDPKSGIDSEKSKLPLAKPKVTAKPSTISPASTQQTVSTPLNADQFIIVAPPAKAAPKTNVATSPKVNKAKKIPSPAKSNQQKTKTAATSSGDKAPTTPTTLKTTTTSGAATATIASTAATTFQTTTTNVEATAEISSAAKIATEHGDIKESSSNLAKFATVYNLAQCLQDVDADIADYYSSSAELSDGDSNLSDISSPDGCENLSASMKKKLKLKKKKERKAEKAEFDPQKKIKIDVKNKCYVKEEKPRFPLVATPRPLWKREKIEYPDDDTDSESESDTGSNGETTEDSEECTTSEEYEDDLGIASGGASGATKVSVIRMSTCSNDSGFEGGTAPSSPKKMLECDVNCHKKCERLTANLCGVNQKLIVEALAHVKRGAREARDSPSSPPCLNSAYKIYTNVEEEEDETSHTYSEFQKSGRFTAPATVIPKFKNYCVDDFHFLAVLGKGSFGKVLLAELRETTYYYAVKCLKKDVVLEDDDVDSTLIERKVLALGTKHPYLCHLFCTFQTESHLFFVMEYLNGGDLMFHIQESGRFTEERARFYGAEIISGLKFLHKKGIIYRDLKLDNVLLDYEGHVRIADFGMCKLQIYLDKTADSFCGTPDYMAPEIIKGEKYNQNVDWWSFGVLLYEMLIGQSPFSGCDEDELFWSICNEIPWFPVYISSEALSILKGLLEKDYTKRIGTHYSPAGDVKDHKFFRPIDWNLLEKREVKPPFRPQVKHPLDTQYFDRVFTKERVRLTPIDRDILQSMDQKQFLGFTYTNPHIALD